VSSDSFKKNIKGQSLIPLMLGETDETGDTFLYGVTRNLYYVMQNEWKLIWDTKSHTFELYDLREDPLEKKNLFSPQHPIAQNLLPHLQRFAESFKNTRKDKRGSPTLPLQLREELRGLGYVE